MIEYERDYQELIKRVLDSPTRDTRNGTTFSTFGETLKIDCSETFPILQGRQIYWKGVFGELGAFFNNPTNVSDFEDKGCNYWSTWADSETGELNLDYGTKWFDWNGVNQWEDAKQMLLSDPTSRRILINSWDPSNLKNLSLPCCHYSYQFYSENNTLHLMWVQRSVDVMIGLPSDAIIGALLLHIMAKETNHKVGTLIMNFGDTHIYREHALNAHTYLNRLVKDLKEPKLITTESIDNFWFDWSVNYEHLKPLKFELKA